MTREELDALAGIVRGQLVIVDFRGSEGREQTKTRAAIVVSADLLNKQFSTLVVVPVTTHGGKTKDPGYQKLAFEVEIPQGEGGIAERSMAEPHQIRTIDKFERVTKVLGKISDDKMLEIGVHLLLTLGGIGDGN